VSRPVSVVSVSVSRAVSRHRLVSVSVSVSAVSRPVSVRCRDPVGGTADTSQRCSCRPVSVAPAGALQRAPAASVPPTPPGPSRAAPRAPRGCTPRDHAQAPPGLPVSAPLRLPSRFVLLFQSHHGRQVAGRQALDGPRLELVVAHGRLRSWAERPLRGSAPAPCGRAPQQPEARAGRPLARARRRAWVAWSPTRGVGPSVSPATTP
jgi:hypothetical protein